MLDPDALYNQSCKYKFSGILHCGDGKDMKALATMNLLAP